MSKEHKVVDLSYIREALKEEEAEIERIKGLFLFLFGEDEYQCN